LIISRKPTEYEGKPSCCWKKKWFFGLLDSQPKYGSEKWIVSCDLCGRKSEKTFMWSIYTGAELMGDIKMEVLRVGPRKTRIDVCKKHKSSEIMERIDEIEKAREKNKDDLLPPCFY
jgi:hypothetical protein